jgi:glycosyltransferase involved in cell wall biosynthesis
MTSPSGICRHAANLARCLCSIEEIERVTLVVGSWQQGYFKNELHLSDPKLEIIPVNIINRSISRNWWFHASLPKLAAHLKADLVHLGYPMPVSRSLFACPVIATIHDLYPFQIPDNFGRAQAYFNRAFFRLCVRNADKLVCVSDQTLRDLNRRIPRHLSEKALRIHNSLQLSQRTRERSLERCFEWPFILTVAQHRKNKRLDLLIRSFALLRRRGDVPQNMRLVVIGSEGPESASLKSLIGAFHISNSVVMLSGLLDSELEQAYRDCLAFVVSSEAEGFCLPLLEALAMGCRVACSDLPVLREVAGESCTWFDSRSACPVEALADAISRAMSFTGRPVVDLGRFSRKNIAKQYEELYSSVLGNKIRHSVATGTR